MEKSKEVTVSKLFITNRGTLFSDKDLKQYEMPQSKQLEEDIRWTVDIIKTPYDLHKLQKWVELSVIHASCINTKVQDSFGVGWHLKEVEGENPSEEENERLSNFFNKCNEKEDIIAVAKKLGFDYESCGNAYMEVVRDLKEKSIKAIYQIPAATMRLVKDKERWVQVIGDRKVYFKNWGDERILNNKTGNFVKTVDPEFVANEVIQMKQYTPRSSFYGLPDWLPALFQMYGEMKEKEYNLDFFANYGVPAYAVILEGADFTPETEKRIQKYFEVELKGNPHRTMVFSTPEGATVKFEQLSVQSKEASFRVYRRDNRDDVLTAHHVPPYRASIVEKGQLGGSVAEDVDRIYLDSVINPRQRALNWIINELLLWEGFEIFSLEFEFLDIDIRDNKAQADVDDRYYKMGVLSPNEIRTRMGFEPYEGGDVFYVPSNSVPVGFSEEKLFDKRKLEKKEKKIGKRNRKKKTDSSS
ncbi:phage portal protein [Candidatus Omnitrophota bacterium]